MTAALPANADLFGKLDSQIKSGQRKKALKTVEEVLKLDGKDQDAIKTKIFLLIDLDRCQDALTLIEKSRLQDDFQRAYCLYRLGQLPKSLEALQQASTLDEVASLQLKAQLQHRLGEYDAAVQTYTQLITQHKMSGADVKTNLLAAQLYSKQRRSESGSSSVEIGPNDGFEVAYNLACTQLDEKNIEAAKESLQIALRLGRESLLEDDLSEEQVGEELLPVTIQMANADAISQIHDQALRQFEEITDSKTGDEGSQAVALNNKIAERLMTTHPEKLRSVASECIKEIDGLFEKGAAGLQLKSGAESRLSLSQQQILYTNRVLLLLLAGRQQGAKDTTQRLLRKFKDEPSMQLLRVSIAATSNKIKDAQQLLVNTPELEQGRLLQAQLAGQSGTPEQAAEILADLGQESSKPAVIMSRCALLEAAGKESEAFELISAAKSRVSSDKIARKAILPVLARLQLKAGSVSDAFQTFKELQSLDKNTAGSAAVIGQLAAAAVKSDPKTAQSLGEYLRPITSISADKVEELEATGAGRMAKGESSKRAARPDQAPAKRKRKRQKRLPKNFDPENPGPPPDPERWLPKWQRAEFRRKRRNRNTKDTKKGHQGGAVDESLDRTNTETPAAQPNLPKRGQRPRKTGRR